MLSILGVCFTNLSTNSAKVGLHGSFNVQRGRSKESTSIYLGELVILARIWSSTCILFHVHPKTYISVILVVVRLKPRR